MVTLFKIVKFLLKVALVLGLITVVAFVGYRIYQASASVTPSTPANTVEDSDAIALARQAQANAEMEAQNAREAQALAEKEAQVKVAEAQASTQKAVEDAKIALEAQGKQHAGIGAGVVVTPNLEYKMVWPEVKDATLWYRSPFTATTDALTDKSTWETFAEPGVLLNNEAAFDYLTASETPVNVPEGAYTYLALGSATFDYNLKLPYQSRNIYLVIVRGIPSDGKVETDLNTIMMVSDYTRGAGIFSVMPAGAYVSLGWTLQQVQNAFVDSPNCGVDGCGKVTMVIIDMPTKAYRMWEITNPQKIREWTRVK